ncbi:SH3 domain-containing protein C23A1.17-like [Trichogramma pretiosum]|uniref:SH3 domain-containing protein C23A1.17-like n=1 Tax=Trichogramma pretiosum TaxID=7493 RepID=UPI000C718FA0|nr:SH3 domain-containing protein C23A1.17-like [Trichogramma pretiosum]
MKLYTCPLCVDYILYTTRFEFDAHFYSEHKDDCKKEITEIRTIWEPNQNMDHARSNPPRSSCDREESNPELEKASQTHAKTETQTKHVACGNDEPIQYRKENESENNSKMYDRASKSSTKQELKRRASSPKVKTYGSSTESSDEPVSKKSMMFTEDYTYPYLFNDSDFDDVEPNDRVSSRQQMDDDHEKSDPEMRKTDRKHRQANFLDRATNKSENKSKPRTELKRRASSSTIVAASSSTVILTDDEPVSKKRALRLGSTKTNEDDVPRFKFFDDREPNDRKQMDNDLRKEEERMIKFTSFRSPAKSPEAPEASSSDEMPDEDYSEAPPRVLNISDEVPNPDDFQASVSEVDQMMSEITLREADVPTPRRLKMRRSLREIPEESEGDDDTNDDFDSAPRAADESVSPRSTRCRRISRPFIRETCRVRASRSSDEVSEDEETNDPASSQEQTEDDAPREADEPMSETITQPEASTEAPEVCPEVSPNVGVSSIHHLTPQNLQLPREADEPMSETITQPEASTEAPEVRPEVSPNVSVSSIHHLTPQKLQQMRSLMAVLVSPQPEGTTSLTINTCLIDGSPADGTLSDLANSRSPQNREESDSVPDSVEGPASTNSTAGTSSRNVASLSGGISAPQRTLEDEYEPVPKKLFLTRAEKDEVAESNASSASGEVSENDATNDLASSDEKMLTEDRDESAPILEELHPPAGSTNSSAGTSQIVASFSGAIGEPKRTHEDEPDEAHEPVLKKLFLACAEKDEDAELNASSSRGEVSANDATNDLASSDEKMLPEDRKESSPILEELHPPLSPTKTTEDSEYDDTQDPVYANMKLSFQDGLCRQVAEPMAEESTPEVNVLGSSVKVHEGDETIGRASLNTQTITRHINWMNSCRAPSPSVTVNKQLLLKEASRKAAEPMSEQLEVPVALQKIPEDSESRSSDKASEDVLREAGAAVAEPLPEGTPEIDASRSSDELPEDDDMKNSENLDEPTVEMEFDEADEPMDAKISPPRISITKVEASHSSVERSDDAETRDSLLPRREESIPVSEKVASTHSTETTSRAPTSCSSGNTFGNIDRPLNDGASADEGTMEHGNTRRATKRKLDEGPITSVRQVSVGQVSSSHQSFITPLFYNDPTNSYSNLIPIPQVTSSMNPQYSSAYVVVSTPPPPTAPIYNYSFDNYQNPGAATINAATGINYPQFTMQNYYQPMNNSIPPTSQVSSLYVPPSAAPFHNYSFGTYQNSETTRNVSMQSYYQPTNNLTPSAPPQISNSYVPPLTGPFHNSLSGTYQNSDATRNRSMQSFYTPINNLIRPTPQVPNKNLIPPTPQVQMNRPPMPQVPIINLILPTPEVPIKNLIPPMPQEPIKNLIPSTPQEPIKNLILPTPQEPIKNLTPPTPQVQMNRPSTPQVPIINLIPPTPEVPIKNLIPPTPQEPIKNLILPTPQVPIKNSIPQDPEAQNNVAGAKVMPARPESVRPKTIDKSHGIYRCEKCGEVCRSRREWDEHKKKHLQAKCRKCDQVFATRNDLNLHVAQKHVVMRCEVCKTRFTILEQLLDHMQTHTRKDRQRHGFICDQCDGSFASTPELIRHMETHAHQRLDAQVERWQTNNENIRGNLEIQQQQQQQQQQPPAAATASTSAETTTRFVCRGFGCSESFRDRTTLHLHMMVFHDYFICEVCHVPFSGRQKYNAHVERFHPEKNEKPK